MTRPRHERFLGALDLLDAPGIRGRTPAEEVTTAASTTGARTMIAAEAGPQLTPGPMPEAVPIIPKPQELTWWDWAVFLLHTAAEVEHALMAQYLYAAYSLADADFTGTAVPPDAAARTAAWRNTILATAREEMGHLLTEQNLLRFIGGPLNLEREDFPFRSALYPFPLTLEPLSKTSLAKYVTAEMPADPDAEDIEEIIGRATDASGGSRPNRVGILFDTLVDIFADPAKLAAADLRPSTAIGSQATAVDWFGFGRIIVRAVATREEAVNALRAVGEQGEGPGQPEGDMPSHFDRFLEIYRAFPDADASGALPWCPVRSVPTDPTTRPQPDPNPAVERNRITHPTTRLWAQLFDVRYRMLLVDLTHALQLSGPLIDASGTPTPRGHLRDWAFLQMRGEGAGGLRGMAQLLTTRPAKSNPAKGDPAHAGAPFELPYTLAISDDEHSRWRLHQALLDASGQLVAALSAAGETGGLLTEITSIDTQARTVVQARLAAT